MAQMLREEVVEQSVMRAISSGLADFGFISSGPDQNVIVREAFPTPEERAHDLDMTTVGFGFNVDDGGRPAELGSMLTMYQHTLTVWVFATEPRFGRRLAHSLKNIARRHNDVLPLYDFSQDGEPQIGAVEVITAQTRHQANQSTRPYDRYVWTTSITVRDYAYPMQSAV